jgi:hypothetical protein
MGLFLLLCCIRIKTDLGGAVQTCSAPEHVHSSIACLGQVKMPAMSGAMEIAAG